MRAFDVTIWAICATLELSASTSSELCCEPDSGNSSEESTFFEILDDVIYESLSHPRPGRAAKLLADIGMFQECLARVKRMYTEMEGGKIEALRNSIVRLYATRGGPTFTRFPINKANNKRRLLETFDWSEENLSNLNELLEELENVWYALRHTVI